MAKMKSTRRQLLIRNVIRGNAITKLREKYQIKESEIELIAIFTPFIRRSLSKMIKVRRSGIIPGGPGKKCPTCNGTGRI